MPEATSTLEVGEASALSKLARYPATAPASISTEWLSRALTSYTILHAFSSLHFVMFFLSQIMEFEVRRLVGPNSVFGLLITRPPTLSQEIHAVHSTATT